MTDPLGGAAWRVVQGDCLERLRELLPLFADAPPEREQGSLFADAPQPEREQQRGFFAGYRRAGFQGGEHAVRKCPTEGL